MDSSVFDGKAGLELDFFESNYYKLPFCDENPDELVGLPLKHWNNESLYSKDRYDAGFSSPLSPALSPSSSSGSSSGHNSIDHAHLLLNERPDTPLTAVKFEDFTNDYGLSDLNYPPFSYESDENEILKVDDDELNISDELEGFRKFAASDALRMEDFLTTGSERIVDCSFAATAPSSVDNGMSSVTISKAQDGSALIKPHAQCKEELMDFSFSKDQPITSSAASGNTIQPSCVANKPPTVFATDNSGTTNKDEPSIRKSSVEELIGMSDLITLPSSHKIKVTMPQARVTTNTFTHKAQIQIPTSALHTILKNGRLVTKLQQDGQTISKIRIKSEHIDGETTPLHYVKINQHSLPPTPPSSNTSDTEGSLSPQSRTSISGTPSSPVRTHIRVQPATAHLASHLLSSTQRLSQAHGTLSLTEEEKRTLVAEGYSVPSKFPLTKSEEKSLKKIRRKIKNKISAQESRRKKKEYVETLEKRMDDFNKENLDLKRKLDSLENSNRSLLSQLRSLQTLVAGKMPKPSRTVTTQTSSCLMMVVLCFAVFLGAWYPHLSPVGSRGLKSLTPQDSSVYEINQRQSRVLVSIKEGDSSFRCYDDSHCHGHDPLRDPNTIHGTPVSIDPNQPEPREETYDEPAGGRVTGNDTGDQVSKIIANTMEPRTAADVVASRKVSVQGSKMEVVIDPDQSHDVTKKIASAQLVTE